ncbi:MAG: outer membrane beta-barrel protein, partial [Pseudomonadota bacterium]
MRAWRFLVISLGFLGVSSASGEAQADEGGRLELSSMLGFHLFSKNVELGVADQPDTVPSPKSFGFVGIRLGYNPIKWVTLEAETVFIPTAGTEGGDNLLVEGWRGQVLANLMTGDMRPFVAVGAGGLTSYAGDAGPGEIQSDTDGVFHWGVGLKYKLTSGLLLRCDVRHYLVPSTEGTGVTNDFEFHAGVTFLPGVRAPIPPEVAVEIGQPEQTEASKPSDADGDAFLDARDKCPDKAEDFDGFEDQDGCPDLDDDGDGILVGIDGCEKEKETVNGIEDADGCPEKDSDGDGILDPVDRCPSDPEDADSFADDDGCPDPDNDSDAVADSADRCPAEPETKNGYQDDDGCKDELPAEVKKAFVTLK